MMVLGLDPGKPTSYARFNTLEPHRMELGELTLVGSGRLIRPCPMHLSEIVEGVDQAVVEEVGARPEQGVSSVFTFGLCLGTILGAIGSKGIPIEPVPPTVWKKSCRLSGKPRDEAKKLARAYVRELWPENEVELRLVKSHGMAEAALMVRWYFLSGPGRHVELDGSASIISMSRAAA